MKKIIPALLVAAAVIVAVLAFLQREEDRLRALYLQVEDRLNVKKNPMTVEF